MEKRRHHFVPRFLLAGFTSADGFLYVHDLRRHRLPWRVRPHNTGHERDFYTVEIPGEPPTLAEDALETIESAAAPIIRRVIEEWALPSGQDRETLLWFIATLAARVPGQRAEVSRFMVDMAKLSLEVATSTPERYAAHLQRVRDRGDDASDLLSYGEMKGALQEVKEGSVKLEVNRTWAVGRMFQDAKIVVPLLAVRHWCVLVAGPETPDFICSDNPVSLVPRNPSNAGWHGVGWAMPDTAAFVPLTKRIALCGLFDVDLPEHLLVRTDVVAMVNTAALATAHRHAYSSCSDIIWTKANGKFGHVCDLRPTEKLEE